MKTLDALEAAQIFGSGYRDGERGADKRDLSKYGPEAQEEYLSGYEQGLHDAQRSEA
jgi:hypothetical protein